VAIWIIVCIQKLSRHFLQTFRPPRMLKIVFPHFHFIQNNFFYSVWYGWSAQTSPKCWCGKHE